MTVCEVLGECPDRDRRDRYPPERHDRHPKPDPQEVACVRFDVAEAVARLEAGIRTGKLPPRQLVRGRPLCDWLDLAEVAWLLRQLQESRGA